MVSNIDWDAGKAEANLRKQGVSFLEADTVVLEPHAMFFPDVTIATPGPEC